MESGFGYDFEFTSEFANNAYVATQAEGSFARYVTSDGLSYVWVTCQDQAPEPVEESEPEDPGMNDAINEMNNGLFECHTLKWSYQVAVNGMY